MAQGHPRSVRRGLDERQMVQEAEYQMPVHWLLRRASKERYQSVSGLIAGQIASRYRGGSILDIGCGDGRGLYELSRLLGERYRYVGADYSPRAVAFARAFNHGTQNTFIECAAGELNGALGGRRFDVAVFRDVLEHLRDDDVQASLIDARHLLNPGGAVVVTVPSTNDPVLRKHYKHYNADQLSQELSAAGFVVSRVTGYVFQPRWLRRPLAFFLEMPLLWRAYRIALRETLPHNAKMLMAVGESRT